METILRHPYIALFSFLLAFGLHINIEAKADVEELMMKDLQVMTIGNTPSKTYDLPQSTPVAIEEEIEIKENIEIVEIESEGSELVEESIDPITTTNQ